MSKPITRDLGTVADIAIGGTTPSSKLDEDYSWSIAPVVVGVPGVAKYTVEVSQDNVNYYDYKVASTNVPILDAVQDETIPWNYLRILVTAGGASAGTAQFSLQGKR